MEQESTDFKGLRLTEAEFCTRVGVCRDKIREMRRKGLIKYCPVGRRIYYLPRHVEEFPAVLNR